MTLTFASCVLVSALAASQNPQQIQQPPPPPPPQGKISGTVTNSITGRPIEGVVIRLIRWDGGLGQQIPPKSTAPDGRFLFEGLRFGDYSLTFSASGYVTLQFGQRQPPDIAKRVDLTEGQHFDKADIALPPTSAVEGRLLDEFGDPAPGIVVQVSRVQWVAGKRRLLPVGQGSQPRPTDDLGQFRVTDLPPGDYYLMALAGPFAGPNDPSGFAVTYFPGTPAPMEAKPVHVDVARDTSGITFALIPAPMSTVSGVLVDENDKPIPGSMMLLQTSGDDVRSMIMGRIAVGPNGAFTFRNVAPGSYVIQAYGSPVSGSSLSQSPFTSWPLTLAGNTEITDLRVKITPNASVRGKILFEGAPPPPNASGIFVSSSQVNFASGPVGGGPPNSVTREDWTFEVNPMSGVRVIRATANTPWTMKKVTRDGKDITDEPIDFRTGDVDGIEITFTNRGPVLTGSVIDDGKPSPDASVVVFAEDPLRWAFPSRYFSQGRPNAQGGFTIRGLPPGDYLVLALPTVQGTDWQDPEFLQRHSGLASRVTLSEGGTASVALKVIR